MVGKLILNFFFVFLKSISEIRKDDLLSLFNVSNMFARIMFASNKPNGRLLFIFRRLVHLYRIGQLLIPQLVVDTVLIVERLACLNNFHYLGKLDQSLCERPDVYEFLQLYFRGKLSRFSL